MEETGRRHDLGGIVHRGHPDVLDQTPFSKYPITGESNHKS